MNDVRQTFLGSRGVHKNAFLLIRTPVKKCAVSKPKRLFEFFFYRQMSLSLSVFVISTSVLNLLTTDEAPFSLRLTE